MSDQGSGRKRMESRERLFIVFDMFLEHLDHRDAFTKTCDMCLFAAALNVQDNGIRKEEADKFIRAVGLDRTNEAIRRMSELFDDFDTVKTFEV